MDAAGGPHNRGGGLYWEQMRRQPFGMEKGLELAPFSLVSILLQAGNSHPESYQQVAFVEHTATYQVQERYAQWVDHASSVLLFGCVLCAQI